MMIDTFRDRLTERMAALKLRDEDVDRDWETIHTSTHPILGIINT